MSFTNNGHNDTKDFLCLIRNWHNFCGAIWKWSSVTLETSTLRLFCLFLKTLALFLLT